MILRVSHVFELVEVRIDGHDRRLLLKGVLSWDLFEIDAFRGWGVTWNRGVSLFVGSVQGWFWMLASYLENFLSALSNWTWDRSWLYRKLLWNWRQLCFNNLSCRASFIHGNLEDVKYLFRLHIFILNNSLHDPYQLVMKQNYVKSSYLVLVLKVQPKFLNIEWIQYHFKWSW